MDFSLSNEQRSWQMTARKFAQEEIKPISLDLDEAPDAHGTFDWDIIEKGSKLGLRTMAVPKEYGGEGTDYVTQALVMAELARGDSAISKTFSQNWKWSHLISAACNDEQKERFLRPFVADHRFLLGKGITEPSAGSDNRLPVKDDPKAPLWEHSGIELVVDDIVLSPQYAYCVGHHQRIAKEPELWVVSREDGKVVHTVPVDGFPAFLGMSAAGSRLFVATREGKLICYETK